MPPSNWPILSTSSSRSSSGSAGSGLSSPSPSSAFSLLVVLLALVDIRQALQEDHGLLLTETGQVERVSIPGLADLGRADGIKGDVLEPRAGAEHLLEARHHRLVDNRRRRLHVRLAALEDDL